MLTKPQWMIVLALAAAAAGLNAWNWHLSRQIEEEMGIRRASEGFKMRELPVYDLDSALPSLVQVEPFRAQNLQMLFYLSPNCPYCRRSLPYWQQIEAQHDPRRLHLIAIADSSADGIQIYRDALQTHVQISADRETRRANRLVRVPQTVLIDPSGKVLHNWTGDLALHIGEIEQALGVRLK